MYYVYLLMIKKSLEEFEIRRDSTTDCGVSCALASKKIPIEKNPYRLIMGKTVEYSSS